MAKNEVPQLGDEVRDRVTGLKGIVVARTEHIHGCNTLAVQPQELKDGKKQDSVWSDEKAVEVIKRGKVKPAPREVAAQTGGPAYAQPDLRKQPSRF